MQVIRAIVILFGLVVVVVGLYLFVLGVGAPVEIKSIEVGVLKASATGTFVGLLVAVVGVLVTWIAIEYFKKTVVTRREETTEADGRRTIVIEERTVAAQDDYMA